MTNTKYSQSYSAGRIIQLVVFLVQFRKMKSYIQEIESFWKKITYESADPLMRDRFWMGSPVPILKYTMCNFIILCVLKEIMKRRKHGFRIAHFTLAFSFYLFAMNTYFFIRCCEQVFTPNFSWTCQPVDRSFTPKNLQLIRDTHHLVMFKATYVVELMIFILRKKEKLVNFYLFFHHLTFPLILWIIINYHPGGHSIVAILFNTLLHILICGSIVLVSIFPKLKGQWFSNLVKYGQVSLIQTRKI